MSTRQFGLTASAGFGQGVGPMRRVSMRTGALVAGIVLGLGVALLSTLRGEDREAAAMTGYRIQVGPIVPVEYFDPGRGEWVPFDESVSPPVLLSTGPETVVLRDE